MTDNKKRDGDDPYSVSPALTRGNYTLEEIADMMDVTRERVRQIEAMALRKLRWQLRKRGIDPDMVLPDNNDTDKI